ncbi:hypothetical protein Acr_26g0013930 [Actinidia rufa]|uniref:Uncharacterized protein n=1 Tax=Actinidia rufa TaxID=165716 RepID=A0A7J0H5T3_9ERIC|nr:hypothetical protein Acr_26g0013930 [Actinidia rufa]
MVEKDVGCEYGCGLWKGLDFTLCGYVSWSAWDHVVWDIILHGEEQDWEVDELMPLMAMSWVAESCDKGDGKSVSRLLIHCPLACELWTSILSWFL